MKVDFNKKTIGNNPIIQIYKRIGALYTYTYDLEVFNNLIKDKRYRLRRYKTVCEDCIRQFKKDVKKYKNKYVYTFYFYSTESKKLHILKKLTRKIITLGIENNENEYSTAISVYPVKVYCTKNPRLEYDKSNLTEFFLQNYVINGYSNLLK